MLKSIDIIFESLPMDFGKLLSIAFILIRKQTSFKKNHTKSPNICFEGIAVSCTSLLFEGIYLFRRKVEMGLRSICE